MSNIIPMNPIAYMVSAKNCNTTIYSSKAYKELTLQMSTGDWHTHVAIPLYTHKSVTKALNDTNALYVDIDQMEGWFDEDFQIDDIEEII